MRSRQPLFLACMSVAIVTSVWFMTELWSPPGSSHAGSSPLRSSKSSWGDTPHSNLGHIPGVHAPNSLNPDVSMDVAINGTYYSFDPEIVKQQQLANIAKKILMTYEERSRLVQEAIDEADSKLKPERSKSLAETESTETLEQNKKTLQAKMKHIQEAMAGKKAEINAAYETIRTKLLEAEY